MDGTSLCVTSQTILAALSLWAAYFSPLRSRGSE